MAAAIAFAMISGVSVITLTVLASLPEDAAAARSAAADVPPMAVPEPRSPEVPHRVRALVPIEILRVIDGDTIEVRARIWLDQFLVTRVRLRDIDAPEFTGRCPAEMVRAEAAKRHLSALAGSGPAYLADVGQDKYGGRVLGRIIAADGRDLASRMLADGHARTYGGRRRHSWC